MSDQCSGESGGSAARDGRCRPDSQEDWFKRLKKVTSKQFREENAALRSELMQYRSHIFQIQLAAPVIGLVILQQLAASVGDPDKVEYVVCFAGAVSFLLVLALLLLNKSHRAMIEQVGYLLLVVGSPWEMSLAYRRKGSTPQRMRNPAGGRYGLVSFVTHAVLIFVAEGSAVYSVRSAGSTSQWVLFVLLLAPVVGFGFWAVYGFLKLDKHRELEDDAWHRLREKLPRLKPRES